MYKGRSKSKQRGVSKYDRARVDLSELYEKNPPALTRRERSHFDFGSNDVVSFISLMAPVVHELSQWGCRKPKDVSLALNKKGIRTANGELWNPRLAYFLLSLIFNGRVLKQMKEAGSPLRVEKKHRTATPLEPTPNVQSGPAHVLLTTSDIAAKLDAIGRVTARPPAAKKARAKTKRNKAPAISVGALLPRVIGDPPMVSCEPTTSRIRKFAKERIDNPTSAEAELQRILDHLKDGVLRGQYRREHPVSGKWIVDFFFPKIRLAIEVDGSIHDTPAQRIRDRLKDEDCSRFDITVLRLRNNDVFGDRERLVALLREGWRAAKNRENRIIGTQDG